MRPRPRRDAAEGPRDRFQASRFRNEAACARVPVRGEGLQAALDVAVLPSDTVALAQVVEPRVHQEAFGKTIRVFEIPIEAPGDRPVSSA